MLSFLCGLVLGAMFAPFWMMLWTTYIKPQIDKIVAKVK
jgi:hypothetical protein